MRRGTIILYDGKLVPDLQIPALIAGTGERNTGLNEVLPYFGFDVVLVALRP